MNNILRDNKEILQANDFLPLPTLSYQKKGLKAYFTADLFFMSA